MKKTLKRHLIEIFFIGLIGVPWVFFMCQDCRNEGLGVLKYVLVSSVFWILMWKGNEMFSYLLDYFFDWYKMPTKRLVLGVFGHALCTLLIIFSLKYLTWLIIGVQIQLKVAEVLFSITITLAITFLLYSRRFVTAWKELIIRDEKLQKENILSQYETLKNQVNPHFLFNSFNTLTSLIYEDKEAAADYVRGLSNLFRFILETRDKETVTLEYEMKVVGSYVYIQKRRFGDALVLETEIPDYGIKVAPLAVQMLVENAVKHNVVGARRPLKIKIVSDENQITVINNLQKKDVIAEGPGNTGLNNLRARYKHLSKREIRIEETDDEYIVGLPNID